MGKSLGEHGKAEEIKWRFHGEAEDEKKEESVTYKEMIRQALLQMASDSSNGRAEGSFREICRIIQKRFWKQLNWKPQSDLRRTPVWKSSVRKILFSNKDFEERTTDRFVLVANAKKKK